MLKGFHHRFPDSHAMVELLIRLIQLAYTEVRLPVTDRTHCCRRAMMVPVLRLSRIGYRPRTGSPRFGSQGGACKSLFVKGYGYVSRHLLIGKNVVVAQAGISPHEVVAAQAGIRATRRPPSTERHLDRAGE